MNTVINIRTEKSIRDEAKKIFSKMGLSTSAGINMFLNQVVAEKGFPFKPTADRKKVNARWDREIAEAIKSGKRYTAEDVLRDL
jgi:addiction module RelB/DinJ family antitoxin